MPKKDKREKYAVMRQKPMIIQAWIYTIIFVCIFMIIVGITMSRMYAKKCASG